MEHITFFTYFIICFMVSSFTVVGIMLARRIFQKQLSAKGQYHLWFLLFIALVLPFTPVQYLPFESFGFPMDAYQSNEPSSSFEGEMEVQNSNWMQDYSISVNRSNIEKLNLITACIWFAGMLFMMALALKAWFEVKRIKRTTFRLENKDVQLLFEECKKKLNISGHVVVGKSRHVKSPMTFGFIKNYVVLPSNFDEWLTLDEIKYIFLHELHHYKSKDTAVNYLMVIFQIIYWFNPFVWLAFRKIRLDREIACDHAVLSSLDEEYHRAYGLTIIHFIDKVSRHGNFNLANQFNGSKSQIKSRIQHIASFKTETLLLKLKSTAIFTVLGLLVAGQIPIISAMANDSTHYNFKNENVLYMDVSEEFANFEGSFVLYDSQADQYHIYNEEKSTFRVSPNSTYKIYSALFGLESQVISAHNSLIKWNGTQYPFDSWNSNQNLSMAMQNSVTWYFQDIDKRNEAETIQSYLKQLKYGNSDMSGGIDQFWLESSLKISPVEQVQLLKSLSTNQLGFKKENLQTVKEAMKLEQKNSRGLYGKTGTGTVNGNEINGWFIGYVESEENTYYFATNIQNEENASGKNAAEITLSILKEKGIY